MYSVKQITVDKTTADRVRKFMAFEKPNDDDFINEKSLRRRIRCKLEKHISQPTRANILSALARGFHL